MAGALHDPTVLPTELPAPVDDGTAAHLTGAKLPDLALAATDGSMVDLAGLTGRTVVYIYPRTGRPGQALPTGWDTAACAQRLPPASCSFQCVVPQEPGRVVVVLG